MKKSSIIYVHGFMSGRSSNKWQYLSELPDVDAYCFEVDYKESDPTDIVRDLISLALDFDDPIIVGHSLGGFITRLATNTVCFRSVLVNPSFSPTHTLFRGGERSLPQEFYNEYFILESRLARTTPTSAPEIILVEFGDAVVDHKRNSHLFVESDLYAFPDGDHSFTRLNKIGEAIKILENRPWQ